MDLLRDGLLWLDAPVRYGIVSWLTLAATIALAGLTPGRAGTRSWRGALAFALAVTATLLAFRWPVWFSPEEFNPDESQIIAGAITLKAHPLYWKYVDGGTHGPLSEYLLVFVAWLGAPLNHVTARLVATLLQAVALLGVWRTLRSFASERVARLGILPGLAFWAFIAWLDFLHYGTELPGIALLSLATWAVTGPLTAATPSLHGSRLRFFLGGCALGLVPLAKLQLIPLAAGLVLVVAGVLLADARRNRQPVFSRPLLAFVAGLGAPVLLLLAYLAVFGLFGQFWRAYVVSGVAYSSAGHHPFNEMPSWFFHFSATAFAFAWFFWGSLSFALLFARGSCPPALQLARRVAWAFLGIAMYCVLRPSREVAHYLHILVIPLTLLCGLVLAGAVTETPERKLARLAPWLAFVLLALVPQVHFRTIVGRGYAGNLPAFLAKPRSEAAEYLRQHRQPGDTLAMWGWEPMLFVETQLPQGTREAVTAYQLTEWPLRDFYLNRYQHDLLERRPAWFVDAVGPGAFVYEHRHATGHETIPAVRDVIARDYELVADLSSKRIYRLKASPLPPAP